MFEVFHIIVYIFLYSLFFVKKFRKKDKEEVLYYLSGSIGLAVIWVVFGVNFSLNETVALIEKMLIFFAVAYLLLKLETREKQDEFFFGASLEPYYMEKNHKYFAIFIKIITLAFLACLIFALWRLLSS